MLIRQKILALSLFTISFQAFGYICQPSDANNFEGYSDEVLYNKFYLYNAKSHNYTSYQIVQTEPGSFQQEYWCLYRSDSEKNNHNNSCDNRIGARNVCPISIGGYVDGVTNFKPYLDPLTHVNCAQGNVCLDIPQTLSIQVKDTGVEANGSHRGTFLVGSNGWVDFSFSSTSFDNLGNITNTPHFYKQSVDAKNNYINNQYEIINAKIGVDLVDADLIKTINTGIKNNDYWKYHSGSPMGLPENFILPFTNSNSPGYHIGAFSPAVGGIQNDDKKTKINVYVAPQVQSNVQSGDYKLNIELHVTAHETH